MGSAAEARAAGRRMYAEALRNKERLEAKRQEQQDLEALEDLQRVSWFEPETTMRFPKKGKQPIYFQYETSSGMINCNDEQLCNSIASTGPFWELSNNANVWQIKGFPLEKKKNIYTQSLG